MTLTLQEIRDRLATLRDNIETDLDNENTDRKTSLEWTSDTLTEIVEAIDGTAPSSVQLVMLYPGYPVLDDGTDLDGTEVPR